MGGGTMMCFWEWCEALVSAIEQKKKGEGEGLCGKERKRRE